VSFILAIYLINLVDIIPLLYQRSGLLRFTGGTKLYQLRQFFLFATISYSKLPLDKKSRSN